ncbi:MAG: hypothetical protein R2783_02555 [Gelidibacter sp.]
MKTLVIILSTIMSFIKTKQLRKQEADLQALMQNQNYEMWL